MKKVILLCVLCLAAIALNAQDVSVTNTTTESRTEPYVIYGYLKVFPNDLGTFDNEPQTVITRINQLQQYGYGTWRLPTNEELALMRGSNVVGLGNYMTKENKKGIVRLVTDGEKGEMLRIVPNGYVDLGLPSGTLWKDKNEEGYFAGGYYPYDKAVSIFGDKLPTKAQLEELKNSCRWNWTGSGFEVVGPNGESINLPADGFRISGGTEVDQGCCGYYLSSTLKDSYFVLYLFICQSGEVSVKYNYPDHAYSVRLVQN